MRRALTGCVSLALLVSWDLGCRAGPPTVHTPKQILSVDARPAPRPDLSPAEVDRGANLCLNKCVRCHKLYAPAQYSDMEWRLWMTKMTKKAHLTRDQAELLGRYLEGFRTTN
ncbi:MAG TPA: hypothetical protein VL361_12810 [Candidatus Limnocylindrales bacterium]|jgi:hypothetical protein|nr:hypothetical protein [Candidatus Limnocylindrales bacterium]